jgi:PleD family two-component response regulator
VTVSAGCATWAAGESADDVLRRADAALYGAKRAGRDTVQAAS